MHVDDDFLEFAYEALQETIPADRHVRKDMIQFLLDEGFWPAEMKWESAVARFNACLNRGKAEYFKVSELWALMRRFGRHQLFLSMAEDLGYEVRKRTDIERVQMLYEEILGKLDARDSEDRQLRARADALLTGLQAAAPRAASAGGRGRVHLSRAADAI